MAVAATLVRSRGDLPAPDWLRAVAAHVPGTAVGGGILRASALSGATSAEAAAALGTGREISAPDTVPFALWAAAAGGSFEDVFWRCVAGLGDRDTTCAIACGVAAGDPAVAPPAAWLAAREPLPDWLG